MLPVSSTSDSALFSSLHSGLSRTPCSSVQCLSRLCHAIRLCVVDLGFSFCQNTEYRIQTLVCFAVFWSLSCVARDQTNGRLKCGTNGTRWRRSVVGRVSDLRSRGRGFESRPGTRRKNSGQVSHTYVPLFTKQYKLVPAKGR